jgi:hypothetical protein
MRRLGRAGTALCLMGALVAVPGGPAQAQCDSTRDVQAPELRLPAAIGFFAPFFFPKLIEDEAQLKDYIRSDEFREVRRQHGDLCAVDRIFQEARALSWDNCYEALFIALFATMDHSRVGIRIPLIGSLLWLPLTSEFREDFAARLDALPVRLYSDTPAAHPGDRDKLQHFFGSAFLAFLLESPDAADRVGNFIEWGEDVFVVGGVNDPRDVRANRQGQAFARRLLDDRSARPSEFFESPSVARNLTSPFACAPDTPADSLRWLMEVR